MKYFGTQSQKAQDVSRPARGAWVEIEILTHQLLPAFVAPRKGRVG